MSEPKILKDASLHTLGGTRISCLISTRAGRTLDSVLGFLEDDSSSLGQRDLVSLILRVLETDPSPSRGAFAMIS